MFLVSTVLKDLISDFHIRIMKAYISLLTIYSEISKYNSWTGWQGIIHNPSTFPKDLLYIYLK